MGRKYLLYLFTILTLLLTACDGSDPLDDNSAHYGIKNQSQHLGIYVSDTTEKFWIVIKNKGIYQLCNPQRCESGEYWGHSPHSIQLEGFYRLALGEEFSKLQDKDFHKRNSVYKPRFSNKSDTLIFDTHKCNGARRYCLMFGYYESPIRFERVYSFPVSNKNDMPPKRPKEIKLDKFEKD